MNNFYQQFLRNSQNGIPVEVALGTNNRLSTVYSVCLEGEYIYSSQDETVMAYLRLDLPTGRLLTHFLRASIESKYHRGHFEQNCFTCSDQSLSPGVVKALGWRPGKYHLASGHYPILEDADFYTVSARVGRPVCTVIGRRTSPTKQIRAAIMPT